MALLQTFWPHDRLVRCEALQVGRLAVQTRRQAPHKSYCSSLCWLLTAFHCTCIFTISGRELHRMQQDSRKLCALHRCGTWRSKSSWASSEAAKSDHPMSHLGASVEIGEAIDKTRNKFLCISKSSRIYQIHLLKS